MAGKNEDFTKNLLSALRTKGIDYRPNAKTGLKKFAKDNQITYTTLHKCLREENHGHVPEWDQLLKISKAVDKSIDWLLTGREEKSCPIACDEEVRDLCGKVKDIKGSIYANSLKTKITYLHKLLASGQTDNSDLIKMVINKMAKFDSELQEIKEYIFTGQNPGIQEKPAKDTRKRKKVG